MPRNRYGKLWPGIEGTRSLACATPADEIKLALVKDTLNEYACMLLPFLFIEKEVILLLSFRLLHLPTHFNGTHRPFQGALSDAIGIGQGCCLSFLVI